MYNIDNLSKINKLNNQIIKLLKFKNNFNNRMIKFEKIISLVIFLNQVNFCLSSYQDKNNLNEVIYKYQNFGKTFIDINFDEFTSNIFNNNEIYYKLLILNDSEQIFFDYQSEYGCLFISFEEEIEIKSFDFQFCANGTNNIFNLTKTEILNKIENTKKDSIENLTIVIGINYSYWEKDSFSFEYSLKVSLRKPNINIFKVNSDHKILCTTEKINENNYKCLFMIINNNNEDKNKTLIIYSNSKSNFIKLNINADYINKDKYDNWDNDYLSKNIPNKNSNYSNYNKEMDFITIPNLNNEKYIYISIESSEEATIEILNKIINYEESVFPNINDIQIYSIKQNCISLDLTKLPQNEVSISLMTLYGKGNVLLEYDKSTKYFTDSINNKLLFDINLDLCYSKINCKLTVNILDEGDEKELGYLFSIYITKKIGNNILKELTYGKSSISYNTQLPLILYEQIQNIYWPLNINLQLYNNSNINIINNFDIEVRILPNTKIYNAKLDYNFIFNYEYIAKGKFDSILSVTNFFLNLKDIIYIPESPYIVIYITNNIYSRKDFGPIILGLTISQVNSLIYPSERIYHYGQINNLEKIIYKLKGNNKYHLMRLEFGCNSNYIGWSVKRNNDNTYMKNDTDLSFVTEKWSNGRALLTMYIERGEDIYLTIFPKEFIENIFLTNYIFKYVNAAKNGDFKNYIIKNDKLKYNEEKDLIKINNIKNIPYSLDAKYYLKIINETDYIKDENINTIAITKSYYNLIINVGLIYKDYIEFNLHGNILKENNYTVNVYSIFTESCGDIEYLSHSFIKIYCKEKERSKKGLIIGSIVIASILLFILVMRCLAYCLKE